MTDDGLDYEDVVDVWERERDSEQPCALPDNFYQRLREYIQDLEVMSEEIGLSPANKRERRIQKQYQRVKNIADRFFKERQRKIVLSAYHKSLGQDVNASNLIDRELQLLNEVSSLLEEQKNIVFLGEYKRKTKGDKEEEELDPLKEEREESMGGEKTEAELSEKTMEEEEYLEPEKEDEIVEPSTGEKHERGKDQSLQKNAKAHEELLIHITDDIPPFVDIDTTYDLNKEDVVTLNKDIAQVLIERDKARKIKL